MHHRRKTASHGEAERKKKERAKLRAEMEECARVMHDEIMLIQAEFEPLEAEVDRLLSNDPQALL